MIYTPIHDIVIETSFVEDYLKAPEQIKKKMDWLVGAMLDLNHFPPSVRPHFSDSLEAYIGYVNQHNLGTWRFIFDYLEGKLYLKRLLTHNRMDNLV